MTGRLKGLCASIQAPELSYRFHPKYPLGKNGPLEQITGNNVLRRLREMATDLGIQKHTDFCSEVETIRMEDDRSAAAHSLMALAWHLNHQQAPVRPLSSGQTTGLLTQGSSHM